jgi:hypothetical protein
MADPGSRPDEVAAAAAGELSQIDSSPIETLTRLKTDRERLESLVQRATENREGVSDVVYQRVIHDYDGRIQAVEAEARPLRELARGEFRKLRDIHGRLRTALDAALLDRQEIDFRHSIGEMEEADFQTQHEAAAAVVEKCQAQFDETEVVRQRFLALIPEEPEPPAPKPAPTPAPKQAPTTPAAAAAARGGTMAGRENEPATLATPLPPLPPKPEAASGAVLGTMAVPVGRLVAEDDSGSSFLLGTSSTVGRTSDNDIPVNARAVSRRHARIDMTGEGYVLKDLGSGNGTFVNDERIEERLLKNGDHVRFGTEKFVFRGGD